MGLSQDSDMGSCSYPYSEDLCPNHSKDDQHQDVDKQDTPYLLQRGQQAGHHNLNTQPTPQR